MQFPNASLTAATSLILPQGYSVLRAGRGILIMSRVNWVERTLTG